MQALNSIFEAILEFFLSFTIFAEGVANGFQMIGDYLFNAIEAMIVSIGLVLNFIEFFYIFLFQYDVFLPTVISASLSFLFVCIVVKLVIDIFL